MTTITKNPPAVSGTAHSQLFLTIDEVADLLRTSRKAIYAMVERGSLPGVTRVGRRVLIRTAELLDWLDHKAAPSLMEKQ
jgi:excisionase family DNA binding protein